VRLASQLTGWKLDIISESKFKAMEEDALTAFREIEGVDENLARAMYKLGFRALEEVAEAGTDELVTIEGIEGPDGAKALQQNALSAMDRLRVERLEIACNRPEPPTERELLQLVPGVGLRTLQFLEEGGYRQIRDVVREDPDRLSIKTGLSNRKARTVQAAAKSFLSDDLPEIEARRVQLRQASEAQTS
jgi:N utilization substance protein A